MALNMRAPSRAPVRKKKSIDAQAVLDRLEGYLEGKIPEPMQWLVRFWEAQAAAFTYQELRAVAANQTAPDTFFAQWFQDYSRLMESRMTDLWRDAFMAGSRQVLAGFGDDVVSPTEDAVRRWTITRSGDLITRVTNDQIEAVRYILAEAHSKRMGVEETARYIRPIVGLTRPQAESNLKLYEKVKENLRRDHPRMKDETVERRAREAAAKYAGEQQRYRAQLIAETEMLSAYNHGADEAVRQNMSMGLMPVMRKVWSTAMNGRVCEACQDLEGMEVGMDEEYSVQIHSKRDPERVLRTLTALVPPLHPRCHCALMYVEAKIENGTVNLENENASYEGIPKTWVTIDSEEDINDISKVNPTKDKANCVNCVIAYEMRQQGKAVYAGPQIKKLQHYPILGWIDPDVRNIQPGENASEILKNYLTEVGEGARIQINILWNKKTSGAWDSKSEITGHSFVGTLKNNKYHYIDVQTDSEYNENIFELCNQKPITYWRINGLTPSDLGASACRKE